MKLNEWACTRVGENARFLLSSSSLSLCNAFFRSMMWNKSFTVACLLFIRTNLFSFLYFLVDWASFPKLTGEMRFRLFTFKVVFSYEFKADFDGFTVSIFDSMFFILSFISSISFSIPSFALTNLDFWIIVFRRSDFYGTGSSFSPPGGLKNKRYAGSLGFSSSNEKFLCCRDPF